MPRVPVPEDYSRENIVVAGTDDYHYPDADVQVDDKSARSLQVREDGDGRYVGPPEQYAVAVRAFLGVTAGGDAVDKTGGDSDSAEPEPLTDGEIIESGECPWCDEYTGEHVGRHASSAHSEKWSEYRD